MRLTFIGVRGWTRTEYDIPARWDGVWLGREILPHPAAAVAVAPPQTKKKMCFLGNGFLHERVEYERSRRDTTAILIVRTLRFFLWTLKKMKIPKIDEKHVAGTFLG